MTSSPPPLTPEKPGTSRLRIDKSLLARAMADDPAAQELMFRQFLPGDEPMRRCAYLGMQGIWGFGTKSFACLTDRRLCGLRVGVFGEVIYQDGYLEHVNSGVVYQPSRLLLYILQIVSLVIAVVVCLFAQETYERIRRMHADGYGEWVGTGDYLQLAVVLVLAPLTFPILWFLSVKLFYLFKKCGVIHWIREGVSVYWFANRKLLGRANDIYREATKARDERLAIIPKEAG